MKQFEPIPKKVIEHGVDPLGSYWQVSYRWEYGGRKFSYGSPRMHEGLTPEDKYVDEISDLVAQVVDIMVAAQCAQVDIITTADGGWTVKVVKRDSNDLYQEQVKTFYDFDEAIAFVKDRKYPIITGITLGD